MKFEEFMNTNKAPIAKEYVKGIFNKKDVTIGDVCQALADPEVSSSLDMNTSLSDFINIKTEPTPRAKSVSKNAVLESATEFLSGNNGEFHSTHDIVTATGHKAETISKVLRDASKDSDCKIVVTYKEEGKGRPAPHFRYVELEQ